MPFFILLVKPLFLENQEKILNNIETAFSSIIYIRQTHSTLNEMQLCYANAEPYTFAYFIR